VYDESKYRSQNAYIPFGEWIINTLTLMNEHELWCAKAIADNAQVPFVVRCDCKPPTQRPKKDKQPVLFTLKK
jgi:hypothetical protein